MAADLSPPGYVLWIQPPEDFERLEQYIKKPRTTLTNLAEENRLASAMLEAFVGRFGLEF